jgi:two-component system sensor histidine kinase AlgZ
VYLYLVAPIIASPVLFPRFFSFTPRRMLLEIGANYFPFLAIPAGLHALYRFVMPSLTAPVRNFVLRIAVHAVVSGLTTIVIALAVHPMYRVILGASPPLVAFLPRCVIIAWTFLLPISLVHELRVRTEAAEAAEKTALRAQLEAIQSRTNPHFLFNALNTIASLVRDDPSLAERTIERLADLLRYTLQHARVEEVSLERELEIVVDYLEIQRARFGEKLRYTIDVEEGLRSLRLPPFLLQPLVENAVLHGITGRPQGGMVQLSARRRNEQAEFRIEDDGPGPEASAHQGVGTGLADLRTRLELLYGEAYSLRTGASELGGFMVELLVPTRGAAP